MSEQGGLKSENEIGSAFIRLGVTGAPETKAALDTAAKQTEAVGTAGKKAGKETAESFADLKTKLDAAKPAAVGLMATFGDVAGLANQFLQIGTAIAEIALNAPLMREQARRQSQGRDFTAARGESNIANSPLFSEENIKAANLDPRSVAELNKQIDDAEKLHARLEAARAFVQAPGTMNSILGAFQSFGASFDKRMGNVWDTGNIDSQTYAPALEEVVNLSENERDNKSNLNSLHSQRNAMARRLGDARDKMRMVGANLPFQQGSIDAMQGTAMPGMTNDQAERLIEALRANTAATRNNTPSGQ